MNKKYWPLLLTVLVASVMVMLSIRVVFAQDLEDIPREETVIFDIDGGRVVDPENFNPYIPGRRLDQGLHQAVMEPLFILNYETGEYVPWLGESMTSNESLDVWTLALRDGVTWSDGEAFNADDVVFTINMLLVPDNITLADAGGIQQWVESVEKVDDLTVQFNLTGPNPRFQLDYFSVRIWGSVNMLPEHIWNGQDPLTFTNYDPDQGWPVFTGPYQVVSVGETEFIYDRRDDWWGAETGFMDLPAPRRLVWTWAGPEEARAALMADNGLDSLMDITKGTYEALAAQNANVHAWTDTLPYATLDPCSRTFEFNTAVAPWDTVEMRQAVNHAIDRNQIVEISYEGTTVPSISFFPAYAPMNRYTDILVAEGVYDEHPLWAFDPDAARAMIEEQGYTMGDDGYYAKDGEQLDMDITTHEAFIEKQRVAAVLVEQFQNVGINATTRNEAGGTWGDNHAFGTFDTRMGWQNCGSVNEPWNSMDTLNVRWLLPVGERASRNQWRWSGEGAERYSELVDQIGTLPLGDPAIEPLFVEAMGIYLEELPTIPITQARKLIPHNWTYWQNWPTAENNYTSAWTWWQSTHLVIHEIQPAG
ncbi:MAG: ABC transporter substrate-binding protein [Anaerolineaceae bacterium]|nr:ABC transporter substrate-binding protein [Anaerolineaceae bacterium]